MTKLAQLLINRGLTQTDLYELIKESQYKTIGLDRINRLITGRQTNYNIETARIIKNVLGVTYNDIINE